MTRLVVWCPCRLYCELNFYFGERRMSWMLFSILFEFFFRSTTRISSSIWQLFIYLFILLCIIIYYVYLLSRISLVRDTHTRSLMIISWFGLVTIPQISTDRLFYSFCTLLSVLGTRMSTHSRQRPSRFAMKHIERPVGHMDETIDVFQFHFGIFSFRCEPLTLISASVQCADFTHHRTCPIT